MTKKELLKSYSNFRVEQRNKLYHKEFMISNLLKKQPCSHRARLFFLSKYGGKVMYRCIYERWAENYIIKRNELMILFNTKFKACT